MPRTVNPLVAVVLVAVLVTGALVAVAGWRDARLTGPVAGAQDRAPVPAEEWRPVGPPCADPTPRCLVPRAVEVGGRVLVRMSLEVAPVPVTAGAETSRTQARVDLPARRSWLMTGVVGGAAAGASGYRVEVGERAYEVATDRPLLLRLVGVPRRSVPVSVTARRPQGRDGRQFVATYALRPDRPDEG